MPGADLSSVGASSRTEATSDVAVCDGVPASIAVLGEAGSVERATRAFVDRFEVRDGSLASCPHEVELITAGQAERLAVLLDGLEADLVAVVDGDGRRSAVLTIPTGRDEADLEPVSPVLEEPLDESPAIVWLKDLDGRYLRMNRRYADQLGTDPEDVCGQTDAELGAARSIEGLRLEEPDTAAGTELLELEYRIGAFEERPAFAVLRFALRDGEGQPTATCSVAAPVAEESLARSECERLMRIDRWGRLDAFAIRQELLDEWGLTLADGSSGPPLDRDERVAAVLVERDEALATAARLEEELLTEREELGSLRAESERAAGRADELDGVVAAEQARSDELERSLVRAEGRVSELEAGLTAVRAELEENLLRAEAVEAATSAPEINGLEWGTGSQRALSAALVGLTEWRTVLNRAVGTLGSEGGWDATLAWCRDDPPVSMICGAVWMRDPAALATFETRALKHRRDASTAEFGRARNRMAATCLLELQSAEDPLLRAAAAEGMGSALLVPIGDGGETIAMLELLSRTATAPNAELMVSLEAIALQLGAIAQLLKFTDSRSWRMGRV
ncbi:MAG: Protein kinase [Solirubrobacterales bacterium]|jgi:PAS domain-containing protein|nr:Protein kinase [Solirubrobacterales bacterium]